MSGIFHDLKSVDFWFAVVFAGLVIHVVGTYLHAWIDRARGTLSERRRRLSEAQRQRVDAQAALLLREPARIVEMKVDHLHVRQTAQNQCLLLCGTAGLLILVLSGAGVGARPGTGTLSGWQVINACLMLVGMGFNAVNLSNSLRRAAEISVVIDTFEDKREAAGEGRSSAGVGGVAYGDRVVLTTFDGNLWRVDVDEASRVKATNNGITGKADEQAFRSETFEVISPIDPQRTCTRRSVKFGDQIALRWIVNDRFVGADLNNGGNSVVATATVVGDWEKFHITPSPAMAEDTMQEVSYGMPFGLYAFNKTFVGYAHDTDKSFCACVSRTSPERLGDWERFMFIKPF